MMTNEWKKREGIVYSTKADFVYQTNEIEEPETLPAEKQKLKIALDRKQRKGKTVVLITGFVGKSDDLENLAKELKNKCGTGGSAKNGEIIIQGEMIEKVKDILRNKGFKV
ncbi:MAG: translation initiation factor [Bacteroidota bacterium]|nr:translation initiation factor [Bacteroidales bacterium]MDI9534625.1 translation initiation factor [Bacteroidota bacterium]HNY44530.1 translation initiation factor [Bacteroidales bacterium]HOD87641.1 translation initiation factor [Bacteroidales bacterium]HOE37999.1 translation initiation factor [Bacteroidales bacterium]